MKKYLTVILIIVIAISGFLYVNFKFNHLEYEIERSTLFISDTLDAMYFD